MKLQVYEATIDPSPLSDLEVSFIGLVDAPAIEKDFQAFNKQKLRTDFAANEELHILVGPAMVADLEMYRNDGTLGEYYVKFSAQTIQTIVEKFSAKGLLKNFNLFHDENQKVDGVVIFNSFVTSKKLGISAPAGYEDLAEGSWFIAVKINNPEVWDKYIKTGLVKGFSVEGIFEYIPAKFSLKAKELSLKKIKEGVFEILQSEIETIIDQVINETVIN